MIQQYKTRALAICANFILAKLVYQATSDCDAELDMTISIAEARWQGYFGPDHDMPAEFAAVPELVAA